MDGLELSGKTLKVSAASETSTSRPAAPPSYMGGKYQQFENTNAELDEDSAANYIHSSHSRAILMQKLTRDGSEMPGTIIL